VIIRKEGQLTERLQKENRPAIIDFTADWCSVCKVLEQKTFSADPVIEKSKAFLMIRVNCTSPTEEVAALTERFKVSGLPTVVFINRAGEVISDLTVTGFLRPAEMIARMEQAAAE
jgi:thiol:disulfide interchange protein DsbD